MIDTKFLHGCTEGQVRKIAGGGVTIIKSRRFNVGNKEIFVLTVPAEQWPTAREIKHDRSHG